MCLQLIGKTYGMPRKLNWKSRSAIERLWGLAGCNTALRSKRSFLSLHKSLSAKKLYKNDQTWMSCRSEKLEILKVMNQSLFFSVTCA